MADKNGDRLPGNGIPPVLVNLTPEQYRHVIRFQQQGLAQQRQLQHQQSRQHQQRQHQQQQLTQQPAPIHQQPQHQHYAVQPSLQTPPAYYNQHPPQQPQIQWNRQASQQNVVGSGSLTICWPLRLFYECVYCLERLPDTPNLTPPTKAFIYDDHYVNSPQCNDHYFASLRERKAQGLVEVDSSTMYRRVLMCMQCVKNIELMEEPIRFHLRVAHQLHPNGQLINHPSATQNGQQVNSPAPSAFQNMPQPQQRGSPGVLPQSIPQMHAQPPPGRWPTAGSQPNTAGNVHDEVIGYMPTQNVPYGQPGYSKALLRNMLKQPYMAPGPNIGVNSGSAQQFVNPQLAEPLPNLTFTPSPTSLVVKKPAAQSCASCSEGIPEPPRDSPIPVAARGSPPGVAVAPQKNLINATVSPQTSNVSTITAPVPVVVVEQAAHPESAASVTSRISISQVRKLNEATLPVSPPRELPVNRIVKTEPAPRTEAPSQESSRPQVRISYPPVPQTVEVLVKQEPGIPPVMNLQSSMACQHRDPLLNGGLAEMIRSASSSDTDFAPAACRESDGCQNQTASSPKKRKSDPNVERKDSKRTAPRTAIAEPRSKKWMCRCGEVSDSPENFYVHSKRHNMDVSGLSVKLQALMCPRLECTYWALDDHDYMQHCARHVLLQHFYRQRYAKLQLTL